jgi:tetratricopeptide (TPR) repeat protein
MWQNRRGPIQLKYRTVSNLRGRQTVRKRDSMQIIFRGLMAVILALALPSFAATPSEFYLAMLQKGVTAYDAGRFEAAASPLRIAAFGFVDSIEHYELAQIYLTLTYDRLGDQDLARRAARSAVTAERIEARYGSLQLPAATRTAFETAARRLLAPAEFATFERRAATTTTPPPVTPNPQPARPTTPATTQPSQPATTTQPSTINTTRPTTQPQTAATQPQTSTAQPQTSTTQPSTQPQTPPRTTTSTPAPQTTPPAQKNGTTTTTPKPATTTEPKPTPAKPAPTQPAKPAINVPARFVAAEQALAGARLSEARTIYREILEQSSLQREDLLRLAEGFYRSRDFANALRTFERMGTLRRGEEPYRYYIAVAYYETGQYARAKQELTAVLPFIEITPDVARYRTKIEGAVN